MPKNDDACQILTPAPACWIYSGEEMELNGETDHFHFRLRVVAYEINGKTTLACHVMVHGLRDSRSVPPTLHRCVVALDVRCTPFSHPPQSVRDSLVMSWDPILVEIGRESPTIVLPHHSDLFESGTSFCVDRAVVHLDRIQVKIPSKSLLPSDLISLNDADFCDCSLLPNNSTVPIHVSRAILARSSPFFVNMFRGPWADAAKSDKPVDFGWSSAATVLCLIHMYSGWVVGQPLPQAEKVQEVCDLYKVDVDDLSVHELLHVKDLAKLLELKDMVKAATMEMVRLLTAELEEE